MVKIAIYMLWSFLAGPSLAQQATPGGAPSTGIMGYWSAPDGSVLHVAPCSAAVCISIAMISSTAPGTLDVHNPNPALRSRSLCMVSIGTQFRFVDADHAEDGKLYDPMTGKTYSASLSSHADQLSIRGYIGIKAFGRSETWNRASSTYSGLPCGRAR